MKKFRVDPDLCTGEQVCITIAPYVFAMNKEGKSYVVDPEGADAETIEYAMRRCPLRPQRGWKNRVVSLLYARMSCLRYFLWASLSIEEPGVIAYFPCKLLL